MKLKTERIQFVVNATVRYANAKSRREAIRSTCESLGTKISGCGDGFVYSIETKTVRELKKESGQ